MTTMIHIPTIINVNPSECNCSYCVFLYSTFGSVPGAVFILGKEVIPYTIQEMADIVNDINTRIYLHLLYIVDDTFPLFSRQTSLFLLIKVDISSDI